MMMNFSMNFLILENRKMEKRLKKILIIDDEADALEEIYRKAVEGDAIYDRSPVKRIEPSISAEDLRGIDVILLDYTFEKTTITGADVLQRIVYFRENDDGIDAKIILVSKLQDYSKWQYKLENMFKKGIVDFVVKRTAVRHPAIFKFQLDRVVDMVEKERRIKEQEHELTRGTNGIISMVPIEIAQKDGPDIGKIAELDGYKPVQSILVYGCTGTGKGFLVDFFLEKLAIVRKTNLTEVKKKYHHVNCASFGEKMIVEELFGVCKGTATDASEKNGRFADCDGGVLFLDEFEELTPENQAKILVAMEEGRYYRAHGGINHQDQEPRDRPPDQKRNPQNHTTERSNTNLKIIAAINKDLPMMLKNEDLRRDIFYRFDFVIKMGSLVEYNAEQFDEMINIILERINKRCSSRRDFKMGKKLSEDAIAFIRSKREKIGSDLGGNLRQLEKWLERTLTMTDKTEIYAEELEKWYTFEMTVLPPAINTEDCAQIDSTVNESLIVKRLLGDRNRTKEEFIKKYGQQLFERIEKDPKGINWENYIQLRNFKIDKESEFSQRQKRRIAKEMEKVLSNFGERPSKKTVAIAMGMSYGYLRQIWK